MGGRARRAAETADPAEVALDHAIRQWQAEVENARRLAARENGMLALLAAVLGLGLFRFGDIDDVDPEWLAWMIRTALAASLVLVGLGAGGILLMKPRHPWSRARVPSGSPIHASRHLAWPDSTRIDPPTAQVLGAARRVAFAGTARAASSLRGRNVRHKLRLDRGQGLLLWAGAPAMAAAICYILLGRSGATPSP